MSPRILIITASILLLTGCPVEIPIPVDPPEARADYARTTLNTPVTLAPLANDYDPTGEALSVVAIGTPAHGTAVLNLGGTVDYTPNGGYLGGDQFSVTIVDASGNEVTGTAFVTVGSTTRVLFRSNVTDFFTNQLYLTDTAHTNMMVPVNKRMGITVGPVQSRQTVFGYAPSVDGIHVLYTADDQQTVSVTNLFLGNLDSPGAAVQLTDIQSGLGQAIGGLVLPMLSPDNLYAYYTSNELNIGGPTPNAFDVIRVEIANPANKVRMNAPLQISNVGTVNESTDLIERAQLSEDGNYLMYVVKDGDATPTFANDIIYVVDVSTPGVATKISGNATTGTLGVVGTLTGLGFRQVPGTNLIVYAGDENGATTHDLYVVDFVAQTPPQKLSGTSIGSGVINFGFTPDSSRVVYVGAEDLATVFDLYVAQFSAPGVSTRLSKARTGTTAVSTFSIGQDGTYALYIRDDDTVDIRELYMVEFANPTVQIKLNHALRPAGTDPLTDPAEEVISVRVSAGAPRQVLYSTNDVPVDNLIHQTIRMLDVDALGTTTVVGPATYIGHAYGWAPDGDTVVYQDSAPENVAATVLFSVQISAPTVFRRLTNETYGGAAAVEFSFLP